MWCKILQNLIKALWCFVMEMYSDWTPLLKRRSRHWQTRWTQSELSAPVQASGWRIQSSAAFSLKEPTRTSVSDKLSHPLIFRVGLVHLSQIWFRGILRMPEKSPFLVLILSSIRPCGNMHVWLQGDYIAATCRSAEPDGLCRAASTYIKAQFFPAK